MVSNPGQTPISLGSAFAAGFGFFSAAHQQYRHGCNTRNLFRVAAQENPANTSPTSPPTKASGRNTATVVRVEAVMAGTI